MKGPSMIYARELPGGGFVSIETQNAGAEAPYRGRISVERRADPVRRAGHTPPVVAEVSGPTEAAVFHELYPIAADNVAIARAILRWQAAKNRSGDIPRQS
jgi:hypothetical protein